MRRQLVDGPTEQGQTAWTSAVDRGPVTGSGTRSSVGRPSEGGRGVSLRALLPTCSPEAPCNELRAGLRSSKTSPELLFAWSGWPDPNRRPLRPEATIPLD